MSVGQHKYFLVEEAQGRQSGDENVLELGFVISNIQIPKKKRSAKEPIPLLRYFMKGRPTQVPALTDSSAPSTASSVSASTGKPVARPTSVASRESRTVLLFPTCQLRVYALDRELPLEEMKLPYVIGDDWKEVFQSDVHRVFLDIPVTVASLLLLPLPSIISSKGVDKRDRPIRIELWVGAPAAKKSQPDMLSSYCETSLGRLLKDMGSPKRFPHSPRCISSWKRVLLHAAESTDPSRLIFPGYESASPQYIESCSHLDVRVAFPDRLISVGIPTSTEEQDITEWRLAPLFSGPTLRGLTFSPVSRGFQAIFIQDKDPKSPQVDPKKVPLALTEFREEMAEMPLNLVIPASFLDQAALVLEQTCNSMISKTKSDIMLMKKVAQNDQALTSSDLVQKKILESVDKLEKFALEASQKGLERCAEMREIATFYRDQWISVVTGAVDAEKKVLNRRAPSSKQQMSLSVPPDRQSGSVSSLMEGGTTGSVHDGSRLNSSISESGEIGEIPPPPSTPNPFADVILARHSNNTGLEEEGDDEEEREELELKDSFEKVLGVKSLQLKQGENSLTTFRPSTSRKDRRLRFMPINMHMQVLTVRETRIRQPPAKKSSNALGREQAVATPFRQRIRSVVDFISPSNRDLKVEKKSSSGKDAADSGKHTSKESAGGIVPPIMDESAGPLAMPTRRRGRQSILQTTLEHQSGFETPASPARRNRLTSTSSQQTTPTRNNTLDEEDDDADASANEPESFFYDTISAGAPSAHHLTSKYGGLWQMFRELTKAKEDMRRTRDDPKADLSSKLDAYRKAKELDWAFGERCDVVLPQALSILAGSVIARLYVIAAEYSSSQIGGFEEPDDEVAQSIVKYGFLVGWESLLSTHGKELAMLGDLCYAVRYLSDHVLLRLEVLEEAGGEEDGHDKAQDEDDLREARRLLDKAIDVRFFRTNAKAAPRKESGSADPLTWSGPGCSEDGAMWLVVAKIPSVVVEKLPKVLREYIEGFSSSPSLFSAPSSHVVELETLHPAPLPWTCVLFTQGINEMQNLANMMRRQALQEEINEYSCGRLVEYCRRRFDAPSSAPQKKASMASTVSLTPDKQKEDQRKKRAMVAYQQTIMWTAKLQRAVKDQGNSGKSFDILQSSADLVRWLSGIRIASCKSAKDRTAMSLTWEEARLLQNVHHVREIPLLDLANLFREHGTRLINVHKNTGVPRYAFNKTQRSFLPEAYRPPPNTIGGYFGMSNVT